jgi:predicted nucleic acid-binding Zn ribbon protein
LELIGQILNKYLTDLGIYKPIKSYKALNLWHEVVGEKISKVTEPERLSDGKMFVKVKNASWRNELVFHKRDIIDKINRAVGSSVVKDIVLM